jgi:diguanylate cyclase (GGDEF)-like protein
MAGHAAVVIGRHRALEELHRAALLDPLTGLANRRALETDLRERRRGGHEVLVAYIDLDGFKAVNDHIGHDAGDEVLVIVADRLRRSLRKGDVVARMGGDEFVLLLTAPTPSRDSLRERLRGLIRAPMMVSGQLVSIDATVGFSEGPADAQDLLRDADREMLTLKRNR